MVDEVAADQSIATNHQTFRLPACMSVQHAAASFNRRLQAALLRGGKVALVSLLACRCGLEPLQLSFFHPRIVLRCARSRRGICRQASGPLRDVVTYVAGKFLIDRTAAGQAGGKPDQKQERMQTLGHWVSAGIGTGERTPPDKQRAATVAFNKVTLAYSR